MENEAGESAVEELTPGRGTYVAPGWAHRSVNLDLSEPFVTFFVYPGHAGHDYDTIREAGFRKLVLHRDGSTVVVDNPKRVNCTTGVRA
jgi:glucose-6-phosphate isomerase